MSPNCAEDRTRILRLLSGRACTLVGRRGLEPPTLAGHAPQACAYTNSATGPCILRVYHFHFSETFFSPPRPKVLVYHFLTLVKNESFRHVRITVPKRGVEPPRAKCSQRSERCASAGSATSANLLPVCHFLCKHKNESFQHQGNARLSLPLCGTFFPPLRHTTIFNVLNEKLYQESLL